MASWLCHLSPCFCSHQPQSGSFSSWQPQLPRCLSPAASPELFQALPAAWLGTSSGHFPAAPGASPTWGSLGFSPAKRSHCRCSLLAFLVALVVPEPKGLPFLFLGPSGGSISDFSKSEIFLKLWDFPNPNGFSKPKGLFQATGFSKPVAAARPFPRPPTAQLLEVL